MPMAFAPRSGGALPDRLPPARLHPGVPPQAWRQALALADAFIGAMNDDRRLSDDREPCNDAPKWHSEDARVKIGRLG